MNVKREVKKLNSRDTLCKLGGCIPDTSKPPKEIMGKKMYPCPYCGIYTWVKEDE